MGPELGLRQRLCPSNAVAALGQFESYLYSGRHCRIRHATRKGPGMLQLAFQFRHKICQRLDSGQGEGLVG